MAARALSPEQAFAIAQGDSDARIAALNEALGRRLGAAASAAAAAARAAAAAANAAATAAPSEGVAWSPRRPRPAPTATFLTPHDVFGGGDIRALDLDGTHLSPNYVPRLELAMEAALLLGG